MIGGVAIGALTTGLVGRLISSGIQRVGTLTFQKAMRISRIEQVLRVGSLRNPNVKAAVDDFETVVGNRYGELNEQLAQFLEELERGGLITAMVEDALLDRRSPELCASFLSLHSRAFAKDEGDADNLYKKLMVSFTTTFRELSKDKIASDILKLVYRDLSTRFDQIDQALELINKSRIGQRLASLAELQPSLLKIARALQSTTKQIRVETNKGPRSVDISKVYIPPKLKHRDTKRNSEVLAKATSAIRPKRHQARSEPVEFDWRVDPKVLQTISYGDLKLSFSRVVILGDPGGGKSTICQNLCFDLAKQAAVALATVNKPTAQLQKFPIRVVLRTFEKARTVEPQLNLFDFIVRELRNHVSLEPAELRDSLQYLLSTGAAVLAFDGLDEILVTAQRREFVDLVTSFCSQYPLCPTLVTSRLVGYDDAPLSDDFEELILERFDEREILTYLSKFFKVVGGRSDKEAAQSAQDFLRQTAANASDLRTNPLMLGLMAWLFNARGDVPSNRPEIYRECAILMFERWDPDRDIKADVPADFDKLHLFSSLASEIFGDPELAAGVETTWLSAKIREYLEALYENKAQAAAATKAIVKFITGRAWVMTDVGDGVFAFTHQTFLEYFFARFVDDRSDTVADVFDEIMPHVLRREWDVVAHLSLQIKTHRSLRRQNQAIEALITLLREERPTEEQRALSVFSARSLEYLIASESQIKGLVELIFSEATNSADDEQFLRAMRYCASCSAERRMFVRKLLLELIVKTFKQAEQPSIGNLFRAMSTFAVRGNALTPSSVLPDDLQREAQAAVRRMVIDKAPTSEFFALIAWSWFGHINESLLRKHGVGIYFNAFLEGNHYGVDGLTNLVLGASERFTRPGSFDQAHASEAVAALGRVGFTGPLLDRKSFSRAFSGTTVPLSVWLLVMKHFRKSPEALAGAFFVFLIIETLSETDTSHEADAAQLRKNIKDLVMNSRAIRKVDFFPQIAERAVGSVFNEQDTELTAS
jgi:NACHT domain